MIVKGLCFILWNATTYTNFIKHYTCVESKSLVKT